MIWYRYTRTSNLEDINMSTFLFKSLAPANQVRSHCSSMRLWFAIVLVANQFIYFEKHDVLIVIALFAVGTSSMQSMWWQLDLITGLLFGRYLFWPLLLNLFSVMWFLYHSSLIPLFLFIFNLKLCTILLDLMLS